MDNNKMIANLRKKLHELETEPIGEYENPVAEGYARCIRDVKQLLNETSLKKEVSQ